jgi:hypothetical protein
VIVRLASQWAALFHGFHDILWPETVKLTAEQRRLGRLTNIRNTSKTPAMGLLSNLRGNANEIDVAKVQAELEPVLVPGESIGRGFKIFRDMFIFTDHRLIMIDKQGLTGSKVSYHSILYRNVTQFSVETAGSFDADSELKIWVSGGGMPITKEFQERHRCRRHTKIPRPLCVWRKASKRATGCLLNSHRSHVKPGVPGGCARNAACAHDNVPMALG